MRTEIEVEVTGASYLNAAAISGITIVYGINMIPIAKVTLNAPYIQSADGKDFICNPDKYKKRDNPVTFKVNGKSGCLTFTGFFDGMSVNQTVGGIEYSAIFKSQFQRLLEIYPKFLGIMPSSFNPFKSVEALKIVHGNPNLQYTNIKVGAATVKTDVPFGDFLVNLFRTLIDTHLNYAEQTQRTGPKSIISLIKERNYQDNAAEAKKLVENIVTTFVKANRIPAGQCAAALVNMIFGDTPQHLWQLLLECMEFLGCAILVGDKSLFLVPKANFLKGADVDVPDPKEEPADPNVAFPADYNNFNVNDNGYANIRACFIAVTDKSTMTNRSYNPSIMNYMGVYPPEGGDPEIPEDGASGILVEPMEDKLLNGLMYGFTSNDEIQARLAGNDAYADYELPDVKAVTSALNTTAKTQKELLFLQRQILDQFAKIKFLQEKYTGRTGSFTSVFNPYWVPATTGTLYTRFPGLFYNFYVNSVVHNISMTSGSGTAITTVSFDSVRSSGNAANVPGVSKVELYNYGKKEMTNLQDAWIADIGGTK